MASQSQTDYIIQQIDQYIQQNPYASPTDVERQFQQQFGLMYPQAQHLVNSAFQKRQTQNLHQVQHTTQYAIQQPQQQIYTQQPQVIQQPQPQQIYAISTQQPQSQQFIMQPQQQQQYLSQPIQQQQFQYSPQISQIPVSPNPIYMTTTPPASIVYTNQPQYVMTNQGLMQVTPVSPIQMPSLPYAQQQQQQQQQQPQIITQPQIIPQPQQQLNQSFTYQQTQPQFINQQPQPQLQQQPQLVYATTPVQTPYGSYVAGTPSATSLYDLNSVNLNSSLSRSSSTSSVLSSPSKLTIPLQTNDPQMLNSQQRNQFPPQPIQIQIQQQPPIQIQTTQQPQQQIPTPKIESELDAWYNNLNQCENSLSTRDEFPFRSETWVKWFQFYQHVPHMPDFNPLKAMRRVIIAWTKRACEQRKYICEDKTVIDLEEIYYKKYKLESLPKQMTFVYKSTETLANVTQLAIHPQTIIKVLKQDCLEVALMLKQERQMNPLVLNMASSTAPGGGYRTGAGAQEENLFRRSNYFQFLDSDRSLGMYPIRETGGIYSKNVLVMRGSEAEGYRFLRDPIEISFIAVPATRHPELSAPNRMTPEFENKMKEKIRSIFRIALNHQHDCLVLSAMGCGAYGNPPEHVAMIFDEIINEFEGCFKEIYFAIIEDHNSGPGGNFAPFANQFQ